MWNGGIGCRDRCKVRDSLKERFVPYLFRVIHFESLISWCPVMLVDLSYEIVVSIYRLLLLTSGSVDRTLALLRDMMIVFA